MKGTVKRYNEKKGYGFIVSDRKTYFFHCSRVLNKDVLTEGDVVKFDVFIAPRGLNAINIQLIEGNNYDQDIK